MRLFCKALTCQILSLRWLELKSMKRMSVILKQVKGGPLDTWHTQDIEKTVPFVFFQIHLQYTHTLSSLSTLFLPNRTPDTWITLCNWVTLKSTGHWTLRRSTNAPTEFMFCTKVSEWGQCSNVFKTKSIKPIEWWDSWNKVFTTCFITLFAGTIADKGHFLLVFLVLMKALQHCSVIL